MFTIGQGQTLTISPGPFRQQACCKLPEMPTNNIIIYVYALNADFLA
jgi:hypothetical protein